MQGGRITSAVLGTLLLAGGAWLAWRPEPGETVGRGARGAEQAEGRSAARPRLVGVGREAAASEHPQPEGTQATAAGAGGGAPGTTAAEEPEVRRRFLAEMRAELALIRNGDAASWIRAVHDLKMTALAARSADPAFLTILRDEALALLLPGLADVRTVGEPSRETIRSAVVEALRTWDWDGTIVIPALQEAWRDAPPALRAGLLDAFGEIRPPAFLPGQTELRELYASDDADLREAVLRALQRSGTPSMADLQVAGRGLMDPSLGVRIQALALLEGGGENARGWAREVATLWDDPDPRTRTTAIGVLARIHPERAFELALDRFRSPDAVRRAEAVWAFVGAPQPLPEAMCEALLGALADPDPAVRAATANALAFIPALKERSVPLLRVQIAGGGHPAYEALAALVRLDAEGAVPDLAAALTSPEPPLRYLAVAKLGEQAPQRFARELIAALSDEAGQVHGAAGRALPRLREPPLDALIEALDKAQARVRYLVAQTLGNQGARASEALPALERHRDDPDAATRHHVEAAIKAIRGAGASPPAAPGTAGR